MPNYVTNAISGIWNSYGCPPDNGAGISLSLEDVPGSGSLKELLGFDNDAVEKNIGMLRDSSEIRELVIMLPLIDKQPSQDDTFIPPFTQPLLEITEDPCSCNEDPCGHNAYRGTRRAKPSEKFDTTGLIYSPVEKGYMFGINPAIINKILDTDYKTLGIHELKEKFISRLRSGVLNINNSIVRLMAHMLTYNIPPHLNWLLFNEHNGKSYIPPIVMYTQDFSMTLYKEDLSDIWQGAMPYQTTVPDPEPDLQELEFSLDGEELLANYDLSKYNDIKMRIFKCKFRSDGKYDSLIKGKIVQKTDDEWYGFNWPYDNCSIIEYLQVQAGEVREFDETKIITGSVLKPQIDSTITTPPVSNPWNSSDPFSPLYGREF